MLVKCLPRNSSPKITFWDKAHARMQGDYLYGKKKNVKEFYSCQGSVKRKECCLGKLPKKLSQKFVNILVSFIKVNHSCLLIKPVIASKCNWIFSCRIAVFYLDIAKQLPLWFYLLVQNLHSLGTLFQIFILFSIAQYYHIFWSFQFCLYVLTFVTTFWSKSW